MSNFVDVSKIDEERPVPTDWRGTLTDIVSAIRSGNSNFVGVAGVEPLSSEEFDRISGNIRDYGDELVELPEEAWNTSICRWMGNWWDVLVDLFTEEEGESDLVLFVRVHPHEDSFRYNVTSVHVP